MKLYDPQITMLQESGHDPRDGCGFGVELHRHGWQTARSLVARGFGWIEGDPGGELPGLFFANADGIAALAEASKPDRRFAVIGDPMYPKRAIKVAAELAGANPQQLVSQWQNRFMVRPRWAVMLALSKRGMGPVAVGRRLNRDHSTATYGVAKARELVVSDPAFAEMFARVDAA